jgi:hypothetical protein
MPHPGVKRGKEPQESGLEKDERQKGNCVAYDETHEGSLGSAGGNEVAGCAEARYQGGYHQPSD